MAEVGFWDGFGNEDNFDQMVRDETPPTDSLARDVLDAYDISCNSTVGGPLANVDIKRMDAKTVINLSLFEPFAKNYGTSFIEPVVDETGVVDFKAVGTYEGLPDTLIYHTLQTDNFRNECKGVMITGGKPHVRRRNADDSPSADWKPIWGGTDGTESSKEIFYMADKMRDNCLLDNFAQHATMVFDDPNIQGSSYNDGVDNLYEIRDDNPWDEIMGYAVRRSWTGTIDGENATDYINSRPAINIEYTEQALIPLRVGWDGVEDSDTDDSPFLGTKLVQPPAPPDGLEDQEGCWTQPGQGEIVDPDYGVKIEIPARFRWEFDEIIGGSSETIRIDKFMRVAEGYAIGILINECGGHPKTPADALVKSSAENTRIDAFIVDDTNKVFRLKEGYHYVIGYKADDENKDPYLCFADNSRTNDNATYGTGCVFDINPYSPVGARLYRGESGEETDTAAVTNKVGSVLPFDKYEALWIKELWAVIEVTSPSIKIFDPDGHAKEIAENMEYELKPMVLISKPPPIGYCSTSSLGGNSNGALIDLTQSKRDNDPTTLQTSLDDTDFELALDEMSAGSGLSMTLSFLVAEDDDNVADVSREDQGETWVKNCSRKVWELMDEDTVQTTYICGPTCKPILGGYGRAGGIVNSIEYSYSDSGSYTISVNEGPKQVGNFPEISNGMASKSAEDHTTEGVVIQDLGNQCHYKVRIDDMGERIAINTHHGILRVGDRVSCTVHNNPVEQ